MRGYAPGEHRSAEARTFDHIERAEHFGRGVKPGRLEQSGGAEAEVCEVGKDAACALAVRPVAHDVLDACSGERGFKREQGGSLGQQELAVIGRIAKVEPGEGGVDAIVVRPGAFAKEHAGRLARGIRIRQRPPTRHNVR